jgi:hypothetical protein
VLARAGGSPLARRIDHIAFVVVVVVVARALPTRLNLRAGVPVGRSGLDLDADDLARPCTTTGAVVPSRLCRTLTRGAVSLARANA